MFSMIEAIHERVSVITVYNREKHLVFPWCVRWQGRRYTLTKFGFHHTQRAGRKLLHIFSGVYGGIAFRLTHDTETLTWMLEEVSDGVA
jgi:hypothetical protein